MYDADLSGYLSLAELSEGLAKAMVNSKLRLISLGRIMLGVFLMCLWLGKGKVWSFAISPFVFPITRMSTESLDEMAKVLVEEMIANTGNRFFNFCDNHPSSSWVIIMSKGSA